MARPADRGTRRRIAWWCLALVVFGAVVASQAVACPNCKDAVATADPEGMNVARGYFYSILLMLAMPFLLAGSFGIYVWREMRRQRADVGAADGAPQFGGPPRPRGAAAAPQP
ncbi:MAG: hypothetical protein ACKOTB_19300 [Planctomycetia bacterium]